VFGDNGGMSLGITEEIIARQPPEAQAIIRLLLAEIARLEARVKELEGGRKTPQNSSLPPSTVHPHAKPASAKRRSKKKRGGQPGHKKHERPLIPTEDCNEVKPLKPTECRRCGERLSGSDPEPLRHQVWELPKIEPIVTEYQRHRLACPACGETTCAPLPEGVPQGQLNIDETGTKQENDKAWLWTFVARMFTVFAVRATREATALTTFLGEAFHGVVTCDRAKMYWHLGNLQWCWAHLKRDFQAMIDRGTESGDADVRGTCRELYEHRQWLWTFLRHEGVEPTNNAGERSLRHAVIWRKLSFGTQSADGSRFVETMLTVIETCRQQRRNAFAFLTRAVEAHLAHQLAPSLLPGA